MSYITRTGNLAATPVLRENDKGKPYTYARVLVTDRIRKDDGNYEDGGTIGYDVSVQGNQAVNLVEAVERSGNIRITFAGEYRTTIYRPEGGEERIQHEVRADEVGVSLHLQSVTVERSGTTE